MSDSVYKQHEAVRRAAERAATNLAAAEMERAGLAFGNPIPMPCVAPDAPPREDTVGELLDRVIEELRTRLVGAETLRRSLTPDMLHLPYSQFDALRMLL